MKTKTGILIPFDQDRTDLMHAACDLLNISLTAFVRLAVDRALEQYLDVQKDQVDASARAYVEEQTKAVFRSGGKKGTPRQRSQTRSEHARFLKQVNKLLSKMENVQISKRIASKYIGYSVRQKKRNPRACNPLHFSGSELDQNVARIILQAELNGKELNEQLKSDRLNRAFDDESVKCGQTFMMKEIQRKYTEFRKTTIADMRGQMVQFWIDRVKLHGTEWAALFKYRELVVKMVYDNPDEESFQEITNRNHLSDLRTMRDVNSEDKELSAGLKKKLEKYSPLVWKEWGNASRHDRANLLEQRIHKIKSRQCALESIRKRKRQELAQIRENVDIWHSPGALKEILDINSRKGGIMARKGIFADDPPTIEKSKTVKDVKRLFAREELRLKSILESKNKPSRTGKN